MRRDGLELLHGAGMVLWGALLPWGLFELLDEHVWRFTAPDVPCSAVRLCGRCWKRERVPCAVQRLFLFAIPALAVVAAAPFTVAIAPYDVTVDVFGTAVAHVASEAVQRFEFRLLPVAALLALATALVLAARGARGIRSARAWFFGALGAVAFSLMRFAIIHPCSAMPVWIDFWEEATETVAICGVAVLVWILWRPLGLGGPSAAGRGAP